jgi:hypothetical protein
MSTRSGTVYNKTSNTSALRSGRSFSGRPLSVINSTTYPTTRRSIQKRTVVFESADQNIRPKRSNRTAFPKEWINEYCNVSDNDSTSDFSDAEEEEEENDIKQYTSRRMKPNDAPAPIYEVDIDFDEASVYWRANKTRVGESWEYTPENTLVNMNVTAAAAADSIASRVKKQRASKK